MADCHVALVPPGLNRSAYTAEALAPHDASQPGPVVCHLSVTCGARPQPWGCDVSAVPGVGMGRGPYVMFPHPRLQALWNIFARCQGLPGPQA